MRWVVVTRGPRGARAYGDKEILEEQAPKVTVVDSTGAGDVFAAGLVHGLATRSPMSRALKTAVAWGSVSVGYEGTLPPASFPG